MNRPRVLDLFCGAGGTSEGFHRAGFEVVGVDNRPQPRYPFEFHLSDWLPFLLANYEDFDLIVAGPPCQRYSRATNATGNPESHPDLVAPVREALVETGKPYIIENVVGAPLNNPIMLCGTMFGLRVYRHRLFECFPPLWWPPYSCNHWSKIDQNGFCTMFGKGASKEKGGNKLAWQKASGIDWMTVSEMSQAIPPAYTKWLGRQMLERI